ncbi:MAG: protein YeaH [Gammaproteobacteria bacterium]|jgi:uncharacterized sporulation protein YeaH/YhbH (DUF444 family)|nr:protein YeaH [Gammaproteobacteria bacterium]
MSQFIDRRTNGKNKNAVSRQRFLNRFKKQIKESISKALSQRSITDIHVGEKISVPKKDINEPFFHHAAGGSIYRVFPGNREYSVGDSIARPPSSQQQGVGEKASDQGEGLDEFTFEINKDEFLDFFFEDLELPDLVKTELKALPQFQNVKSGLSLSGSPSNINITRSFRKALGRRIAFGTDKRKKLKIAEDRLFKLSKKISAHSPRRLRLEKYIAFIKEKITSIPFIDTSDILYNRTTKQLNPSSQAIMFCVMDVSGSMDETKKDMAKRFFILLYLFLTRVYQKIHIIFIRHHTNAKEVDEEEFFYSRETGGTVVSSALELIYDIIVDRFSTNDWNIYVAQASDGDNWNADSPYCQSLLNEKIMPLVQYYAYVEIMPRHHQSLWHSYVSVRKEHSNFAMQTISKPAEIFPVLHELFKRKVL